MAKKEKRASGFEKLIERAKQIEDPEHREFAIKLFEFGKLLEEEDRKGLDKALNAFKQN